MKWIGNFDGTLADITSVVAGDGLSGGGTTGAVTLNVEAAQPTIESIGTDGDILVIRADQLLMGNDSADKPVIKLLNVTDDDQAGQLIFEKLRDDDAVASGQNLGEIWFTGQNNAQETQNYAYIIGEIDVSTDGEESGILKLGVVNHDGGNGPGLILTGGSENDEIDATIGFGSNSVITVPGDITVTGDITGTLATATQPNIDSIGTDGDGLDILGDELTMTNSTQHKPKINLTNTTDDIWAPVVSFTSSRIDGSLNLQSGEDGDYLGRMLLKGYNDAATPELITYGQIYGSIHDATDGEESGRLTFQVANHDGGLGSGLILTGGSADDTIDATLGLGATSVVTVPGQLLAPNGGMGARHYGNIIKILPGDWMKNDDSSGNALNYKDAATAGIQVDNNSLEAIAFVAIPEGMKATHVDIYCTANVGVIVREESISSNIAWSGGGATTDLAGGSGVANTQIDLSADVDSTATNMLAIKVTLTSTSQRIWGGTVTIAAQ